MIKCLGCAKCGYGHEDTCCFVCPDKEGCVECCDCDPQTCGDSVKDGSEAIALFQGRAMAIMNQICSLDNQKKIIEAQDKEMRDQLQKIMDQYGVKHFENDLLKISYMEPSARESIDSKKLKEELPAIAEKYKKVSQIKGYVKIVVK